MDDIRGLDWHKNSAPPKSASPAYPILRPTPSPSISGRSTPNNVLQPGLIPSSKPSLKIGSKPGTPANDSFASLLSGPTKAANSLSLQERQRLVAEEKAQKAAEEARQFDAHFGGQSSSFSGSRAQNGNPSQPLQPKPTSFTSFSSKSTLESGSLPATENDDDLLAGFSSAAPVSKASHFLPRAAPPALTQPATVPNSMAFGDDDDPFGLNELATKKPAAARAPIQPADNDDDILGMLGRPAEEVLVLRKPKEPESPVQDGKEEMSPEDNAVASLVDMGFTPDQAAIALAQTDSGMDVQGAIGILLNQAHEKARKKPRANDEDSLDFSAQSRRAQVTEDDSRPPWMKSSSDSRSGSQTRSHALGKDKDVTQYASDIGSSLFKSANSLWKTGQRKVQKAVSDFANDPGDSNQPKWMRDAREAEPERRRTSPFQPEKKAQPNLTDEAFMLEGAGRPSLPSRPVQQRKTEELNSARFNNPRLVERTRSPFSDHGSDSDRPTAIPLRPAAHRMTRQELEKTEQEVYVSPARRRRPQPPTKERSLLETETTSRAKSPLASPPLASNNPFASVSKVAARSTPNPPTRPRAPLRKIPPAFDSALSASTSHRQAGSEAFKRGDFAAAQEAYTKALQPLPSMHPVTIVVLCNRSLTNIKVGDPKAAVTDADAALSIIGTSRGDGEKINLGIREGEKDMKEFYGKALMRKAEALENMEKWADAGSTWKLAVESGVGGSLAIQGRTRCDKAVGAASSRPAPHGPAALAKTKKAAPSRSALDELAGRPSVGNTASAEAVRKLRAANAAAEKADDEKFALTDMVDGKLVAWKGTKADNLRALLGSLDKVLWPAAGWNKVGMQDLVMPNRVKIIYMKAIAKVHPDKIPQNATTEQKMISAAVFATLNEAWDKFKAENGL